MRDWLFAAAIFAALVLPVAAYPVPAHAQDAALLVPETPVVQLGDVTSPHCTAFFLGNPDILISAGHCVFATGIGLGDFKALPFRGDPKTDLLPLSIMGASFSADGGIEDWSIFRIKSDVPAGWKPVTLDCHYVPMMGAEVTAIGFPPANGSLTLMRGFINGNEAPFKGPAYGIIPITMAVAPGASGSPVFEPDGRVIGILVAENPEQNGWAYFQPITPICNALHLS